MRSAIWISCHPQAGGACAEPTHVGERRAGLPLSVDLAESGRLNVDFTQAGGLSLSWAIRLTVWDACDTGDRPPRCSRPTGHAQRLASRLRRFLNLRYALFSETGTGHWHVDSSLMKPNRTCRRDATGVWLAALFLDQKSSFSTRSPRTRVCRPPMAANSGTMVYAAEASFGPSNAMWRTARKV